MMGRRAPQSTKPQKPLAQAVTYSQREQRDRAFRALMIPLIIFVVVLPEIWPYLPSPVANYDWKRALVRAVGPIVMTPIPPKQAGLPFGPFPLLQWAYWALALGGLIMIRGLVWHLVCLYKQRVTALGQPRTYMRVRIPGNVRLTPDNGVTLLQSLHGMLPPSDLTKGDGAPLALRLTGKPEQAVQQGVSLLGSPTFVKTVQVTLEGLSRGTEAEEMDDPLTNELQAGRYLCWADLRLAAPDDLPIAIATGGKSPLLDTLLPALAPQVGVHAADVQVIMRPVPDRIWSLRVKGRLEGLKVDADTPEVRVMKAKAAGPAFDSVIRVVAIAENPQAGQAMVQTIMAAFAPSAQTVATVSQRLVAGPVQALPAALSVPVPLPKQQHYMAWALGALILISGLWFLVIKQIPFLTTTYWTTAPAALSRLATVPLPIFPEGSARLPLLWMVPVLGMLVPRLAIHVRHRRRTQADATLQFGTVVGALMPPRNPRVIPVWSDMFGRKPMLLSAAELATIWHPPTADIGDRIMRVKARKIPAPARAFVDPTRPDNLILGLGRRSDGTLAPIGLSYRDLRYVLHITAPMGRGKSEWLKNMFRGLMDANAGALLLDCKGTDLVNTSLPLIPLNREQDVTILDLGGTMITGEHLCASMNLLSPRFGRGLGLKFSQQASTVLGIFSTLDDKFDQAVGIKQFANMGMLALLEGEPNATMMHLIRFFGDEDYRRDVCSRVKTDQVKHFWEFRFDHMPEGQKSSLASFERRLDQLLAYPELAAMLVAPGCSIDLRHAMDHRGILLAGIRATEGQIASIAATLLLTQMTLAALSRSNVVEELRPDWPVVIDEAQIVFGQNPGMANIIFSQLRAFRIGTVVVHQNLDQLSNIMPVLAGNAQNRVILGSEVLDATKYGADFSALGLTKEDFMGMARFEDQYMKIYGCGELFSGRMLPLVQPLAEEAPPPVYVNWQTVTAPTANSRDREIDGAIARFAQLAKVRPDDAVEILAQMCLTQPAAYDAYCRRTREHRMAQRQFILNNPGCIPLDMALPEEKRYEQQKEQRIRILSALGAGVPRLETDALARSLTKASQQSFISRREREDAEKAAKKERGGKGASTTRDRAVSMASNLGLVPDQFSTDPAAQSSQGQPLPSLDDLLTQRGPRRDPRDIVSGMDDFNF